ncbi:hypothetical protein Pelo_19203 [Pelomyxa schiedti]|nr:hypothetical protein Pelo_19203 [Pelomyxa schiedti]
MKIKGTQYFGWGRTASIISNLSYVDKIHSEFEEKVYREFNEMISRLQKRQDELLLMSREIASSKTSVLSRQLGRISAGLMHIEKYKSKFEAILKTGDPLIIIESSESIPGVLRQIECKPEHLTPCVSATLSCCTADIEPLKEKIPDLCFLFPKPLLESVKTGRAEATEGCLVTLCGRWPETAVNQDIRVGVGESECTNVNIVTPGSVLTFTAPQHGVGCQMTPSSHSQDQ